MPHLEFAGKPRVYAHHLSIPFRPLVPVPDLSVPPPHRDTPSTGDNLIIHGDNLDALKALMPYYAANIDLIIIDPPYNTGNEGWIYNDNVNDARLQSWLAEQSPVDGEDMERHDKWLCMMWPRLVLLRELLAEHGAICISIDDNEQSHLRLILDEIFGAENFVANFIWQHRKSRQNDTDISLAHNHIICYARNKSDLYTSREKIDETAFSNPDDDPRGAWVADPMDAPNVRPNLTYGIANLNTGEIYFPPPGRHWRFSEDRYHEALQGNRIIFGLTGNARPQYKRYLADARLAGQSISTIWTEVGTATNATREIQTIFDGPSVFPTPKPVDLLTRIIRIFSDRDATILDSFAGSGTTGQAVLQSNTEDDANRKFILVECEDYADSITAERMRRVISGVANAKDDNLRRGFDGSFTFCELGKGVTIEEMLTGEALPEFDSLAAHLYYAATGKTLAVPHVRQSNGLAPFHVNLERDESYYLFYEPNIAFLADKEAVLTGSRARAIRDSKETARAIVWAADAWISQTELTPMGITFSQLPFQLPGE